MKRFRWDRLGKVVLCVLFAILIMALIAIIPIGIGFLVFKLFSYKPPFDYVAMWLTGMLSIVITFMIWFFGKMILFGLILPTIGWFFEEKQ